MIEDREMLLSSLQGGEPSLTELVLTIRATFFFRMASLEFIVSCVFNKQNTLPADREGLRAIHSFSVLVAENESVLKKLQTTWRSWDWIAQCRYDGWDRSAPFIFFSSEGFDTASHLSPSRHIADFIFSLKACTDQAQKGSEGIPGEMRIPFEARSWR
jgi:hypothetical protein